MVIGFVSCESDDEVFPRGQIVGTWATTQGYVGDGWVDIPPYSDMYATMTFYEDGDYYGDSELFGSGWGVYTLSGKTLKTYIASKRINLKDTDELVERYFEKEII